MARVSDWVRWHHLQECIANAIEDALYGDEDFEPTSYTIAINPTFDEVAVCLDEDSLGFITEYVSKGWAIESATNYEDAIAVADMYFDLR